MAATESGQAASAGAISPALLALLRCPVSGQKLVVASVEELQRLGWAAGLVREDEQLAYPIEKGLPILLPGRGVDLAARA